MGTGSGRNSKCPCGSGKKKKNCCKENEFTYIQHEILGVKVWVPSSKNEMEVLKGLLSRISTKYEHGRYTETTVINDILKEICYVLGDYIKTSLSKINYIETVDFLLFQHEQWSEIFRKWRYKLVSFSQEESEYLRLKVPTMRRNLKHLVEELCLLKPQWGNANLSKETLINEIDKALVAAEQLFIVTQMIEQTYRIFPENTILTLDFTIENFYDLVVDEDNIKKAESFYRKQKLWEDVTESTQKESLNEIHSETAKELPAFLDVAFKEDLGFTYSDIVKVVSILLALKAPVDLLSHIAKKEYLIDVIKRHLVDIDRTHISLILSIFTLKQEEIQGEQPVIWRTKRQYRLLNRPLVQLYSTTGEEYLAWGHRSLEEGLLITFFFNITKRKLPAEIQKRKNIDKAIERLHSSMNGKLEDISLKELNKRGFIGRKSIKTNKLVGKNGEKISIPNEVGEIDLLCIHLDQKLLLVGECKNTSFAGEARLWYEDIQEFITGTVRKASYLDKFRKKINWVKQEAPNLIGALCAENRISVDNWNVVPVMLTTYQTFAAELIDEVPCVSLPCFLHEYDKSYSWPYQNFKYKI